MTMTSNGVNTDIDTDTDIDDFLNVISDEYLYLDSIDNWLSCDLNQTLINTSANGDANDITVWIKNAFFGERSRGSHMTLVNKLDELKALSPQSIDSRTFTRNKQRNKRQSLFNGTALSNPFSPVNEDEYSSPETNDKTFEIQSNKKSLNGTFTKTIADNTFALTNESDIDDVEKIARIQEDSLRQSCANGWSPPRQLSPERSHFSTLSRTQMLSNNTINSNTLTKSRDPVRHSRIANALMDDLNPFHMNGDEEEANDVYEIELSPEDNFRSNATHNTSTPLVSKTYRNPNPEFREPIAPKIMPDVSNLRGNYGNSKIGRSEPNLSRRLQPMVKGMAYNSSKGSHFGAKTAESSSNRRFLESKAPSDSRLIVKNGLRFPQNINQYQGVGRMTSPPPPQNQQMLRKVAVEGEVNRLGTTTAITTTITTNTNLCRKSTFRVRDYCSEDNGIDLCLTNNTIPSTNGIQTNKTNRNTVQKAVSKIPGPKSNNRSGIPVCGQQRTALPCPTNNYRAVNPTDNSWRNGCF